MPSALPTSSALSAFAFDPGAHLPAQPGGANARALVRARWDDAVARGTLQDLAEDAFAWMEGPPVELAWREEFVLRNAPNPSPVLGMVLRPRLADVDAGPAAARAWFAERGRRALHVVDLRRERAGRPGRATACTRADARTRIPSRGRGAQGRELRRSARLRDDLVALVPGNVAEHARGHGADRALVRARRDEAVRRGTPALVVQAGKLSKPILERLGFRSVCEVRILVDSTA